MANYFQTDDRDDYFATLGRKTSKNSFYDEKGNPKMCNIQSYRDNQAKKELIKIKHEELKKVLMVEKEVKKEIQLNESQSIVLQGLIDWSHTIGKENLFATLKGSAGTGKTTITKEFIDKCKFKYGIVVSAPTHKAKKVIERATNLKSFTIQKLLGLRPNTDLDDFNINFPQFDSGAESEIQYYKMLIIDESSMLNTDLFELICKEASRYNVKVLFIGDELQLPPVNEIASKAITDISIMFNLTVIVRQKDTNPLADLLIALRNDILNSTNTFEQLLIETPNNINENEEGYLSLNPTEFQIKMREEFNSQSYRDNKDYCKYTAWTNSSIAGSNKAIRGYLTESQEILVKDDVLMGYKTITDMYEGTFITNSEEYIVDKVEKHINNFMIDGYNVVLKYWDYEANAFIQTRTLFIVNPTDYINFMKQHNDILEKATKWKGKAWKDYYNFKNYNLLISDILDKNGKLLVKKDIDYGYGITVHKTQGSTYENIFVNIKNIRGNKNIIERKKLIYVAMSRCTKKAYIFDKL